MKFFAIKNADQLPVSLQTKIQAIEAPSLEDVLKVSTYRQWVEIPAKPAGARKLWRQGNCQFWGQE